MFHVLTFADRPVAAVREAARVLRPGGDLALVTLDAQGRANSWLLDPEELHARLWKSTPTCELGGEAPVDLKRWCACEACFGRTPDACTELADDPLTADLDRIVSWCPMAPAETG